MLVEAITDAATCIYSILHFC